MLHSDTLAQEFNEILNAVEIFGPPQPPQPPDPLDPAITFYAPLQTDVRDLRLNPDDFQRASDAWYKDGSGIYRNVGINQARFEESRLLMEPAGTNININYNANPDSGLSGINFNDLTGYRAENPGAIAAAGLQDICTDGNVVECVNNFGSDRDMWFLGGTNLNVHTMSIFINTFGHDVEIKLSSSSTPKTINTNALERVEHTETPALDGRVFTLRIQNTRAVQFVLNQLEESPVVTSPIITEGTAGQRAIDALSYADPSSFLNMPAGMALIDWHASFDSSEMIDGNFTETLLSADEQRYALLFLRSPAAQAPTVRSQMRNGQSAQGPALSFNAGDLIRCAVRWNRSANEFQVGQRINNGAWAWGTEITSNLADFHLGNDFYVNYLPADWPSRSNDVYLYNEDRGRAWIEDNH